MTCATLTKDIITTYIPGNPGVPATSGTPYQPAYCSTSNQQQCGWFLKDGYSYGFECWNDGGVQKCAMFLYYKGAKIGLAEWGYSYYTEYTCKIVAVPTCYPAVAATPGTPGIAPTPSQTIINNQEGWNASSRSIDPVAIGKYFPFKPAVGLMGAFFGLAPVAWDNQPPHAFTHGLMIDLNGIRVYESGVFVTSLANIYTGNAVVRIERNWDNTITYSVTDGATTSYTSAVSPALGDLYVYAMLYSGGDRISACGTACVGDLAALSFGATASLSGEGTLLVGAPLLNNMYLMTATLSGEGSLSAGGVVTTQDGAVVQPHPMAMMFSGIGALLVNDYGGNGLTHIPALIANGADYDLAQGYAWLPSVESDGVGGMYVPPTPTHAYGNLPLMTSLGIVLESHPGDGAASLPSMISLAGDYQFGFASTWMPALVTYGQDGQRLQMMMLDAIFATDPMTATRDLVIAFTSTGQLASVQSVSVLVLAEFMSTLLADDSYTLLGEFNLSMLSTLRGASYQTHPGALNNLGRVWVVNVDTAAAWRYQGYGFNSFFKRGEQYYGVAEDGVYLLEGGDDAGANIDARLDAGRSNFGESKTKTVPSVYLAVASEDVMVLRVEADGQEYFYEARSSSAELKNHRVDVGRGLEGAHWSFSVLNKDGADFDLASMEFAPILNKRRI